MGSDETAITIPGGPRVIDVFVGTGRHRAQIIYFFRMQIGSRTPSGTGLGSGSRLDRMRWFLGLPSEWALDPKLIGLGLEARALPSTLLDMYRLMEEVEEYG